MAWRHIELVRELPLQPTSKLILFALASRANDEGRFCWPSMRKLCQFARVPPTTSDWLAATMLVVTTIGLSRPEGRSEEFDFGGGNL